MFRNYLKVALRNLYRYKGFSFINIIGLAIGLTGCMVISLFVWDEMQYDQFIKNGDQIYRIYLKTTKATGSTSSATSPPVFATYLEQQYPEVEKTTRLLMWSGKMLLETEKKRTYEDKGLFADSTFFEIFPLPFLKGNGATALDEQQSVVLTNKTSLKYFGKDNPIGKILTLDKTDFIVKGVLEDPPSHFHLDFNYIMPMSAAGIPIERMQRWGWQQFFTYVKVHKGSDIEQLQNKFHEAVKKEAHPQTSEGGFTYLPFFQNLKQIHLYSADFEFDNAKRGNATYVKGLTIIAIFVLLIACFNFINLATARSFRRAKEIGVRKVIGADRRQLIFQFTGETILLSIIAVIIATVATILTLPYLNNFTGKSISFNPLSDPLLAFLMLSAAVLTGILSGLYPAFILSGFQPVKVLKGLKINTGSSASAAFRQGLVIVQFSLSVLLIVCTVIVYRQMEFLHRKDLGFNKEQIIYFNARGGAIDNKEVFKDELLRHSGIVSVTGGYGLPGDALAGDQVIVPGQDGDKTHSAIQIIADHDYIKTMGLKLVAGRDFSRQYTTDIEEAFIINETAVNQLGFGSPENAIGQRLHWECWIPDSLNPVKKGKVIGVVKDFHVKSLHEKLATTVLQIYPPVLEKFAVKIKPVDIPGTIDYLRSTWNTFSSDYPLDYRFLDENFNAMYREEEKLSTLLWIFTAMAVFVGCIGLFGLSAFSAQQRTKEISIRKILGAGVFRIVAMFSADFLRPVIIAALIAFPFAWWAMHNWLQDFPYRITIGWWIFVASALIAVVIALMAVGFQSLKAATVNPVKNLRSE